MAYQREPGGPSRSNDLVELANKAVAIFRDENPRAYQELLEAFEGKSADVALLGYGRFHIAAQRGDLRLEPNVSRGEESTGRGAISPETLIAILEGRMTPLEAFFKGDLIARANSAELHRAYDYFVRFSDAALRSKGLQEVLAQFRNMVQQ